MRVKVKPFTGRWVSRKEANRINDILQSLTVPDRTELFREAQEYEEMILRERTSCGKDI